MYSSKFSLAGTDDDDEYDEALYHDGHWEWVEDRLQYTSHLPQKEKVFVPKISGPMTFKAELDMFEQRRFQRRYQRKYNKDTAVVTLQDIKDLVLYTAPHHIVKTTLVNALHTATAERFLRALILYCEYYLQILAKMKQRTVERQTKVPSENSVKIEAMYQENLTDLRLLVGKQYFAMILGSSDFNRFHHMGRKRTDPSMPEKECFLYEALIAFSIQIVWIALNRENRTELDVEINRLFRSRKYNLAERNFNFDQSKSMTDDERRTMLGQTTQPVHSIYAHTPFFDEFKTNLDVDYRIHGLGVIQFDDLNSRLKFFDHILTEPESMFAEMNIILGIIGLPRRHFDIMLKKIPEAQPENRSASSMMMRRASRISATSKSLGSFKSSQAKMEKLKDEARVIYLPRKTGVSPLPDEFPSKPAEPLHVDKAQQKKWFYRALVYQKRLGGQHGMTLK